MLMHFSSVTHGALKSANEAVEEDVYEGLSDNNKTVTQPLDNAHSHLVYVGKFTSQLLSCGSSIDGDEEIDSPLCAFDGHPEMELQFHEKSERFKHSSKVMFVKLVDMADARVYPSFSTTKRRSNNYGMLKEFGYDESKIKLYGRRFMEEDYVVSRVSPGGPEPQHHAAPPGLL
ncbi:hypothetical protein Cgig2_030641 [Carnegiea gigantea]|uniref:Uncharacterized protein n=1 Tax=Carnegiea gigantea TaxID=171969 RepID=A0A9Q1K8F8_9CARY|nr:hypothetical protein Cgig2_030641 [Carnegiea gigantea]